MFGGLGRKAKQAKVLYLCRKVGPRPGGNWQVWWTWAKGKAGESVVLVQKRWPDAGLEWTSLVDLGEGQIRRMCCTCAQKWPGARPTTHEKRSKLDRKTGERVIPVHKNGPGQANNTRASTQVGATEQANVLYLCTKVGPVEGGNGRQRPLSQIRAPN